MTVDTDADLGVDADAFSKLFADAMAKAPDDESRRWMRDVAKRAQSRADREYTWCQQLGACCEALTASKDEPHWAFVELFWPRLLEVLTEMRAKLQERVDASVKAGAGSHVPVLAQKIMLAAIERIRVAVAADPAHAVAIDYFRQRACHFSPSKYSLQWDRPKGKMHSEERTNPINGVRYTVAQMDVLLEPLYRKQADEAFIAADIADLVKRDVNYILVGLSMLRDPEQLQRIIATVREARAEVRTKAT
jgi:hypothetical protein